MEWCDQWGLRRSRSLSALLRTRRVGSTQPIRARTAVTIHLLSVQYVPPHWLFPAGVRGSRHSTAAEEKQAWRQWVEELQATIQPAMFIQAVGEGGSGSYAGFLDSNGLTPKMQSAYWKFHRADTAVTKVFNDLLLVADADVFLTWPLPSTRRQWAVTTPNWATVGSAWHRAGVVTFVPVRQNVACHV